MESSSQNIITGTGIIPPHISIIKNDSYIMGSHKTEKGYIFSYSSSNPTVKLLLFSEDSREADMTIVLDSSYKTGDVFSVLIKGINLDSYMYIYEDGGFLVSDPYAECLKYSDYEVMAGVPYAVIGRSRFNWKDDRPLGYSAEELIMYKIHPKGWTANKFSKVRNKGTFKGITEKIPYLLELGINAVEIMPVYEFVPDGFRDNYWGYSGGFYFTPKQDYCACKGKRTDYTVEFKEMVQRLHANGIEVILEMFFPSDISPSFIDDCIRFWRREYHIDGVHLICDERARLFIAKDDFIKDVKLFHTNWDADSSNSNLYEYNEGFMETARRLLKGDENQLMPFLYALRKHPIHASNVNFIAYNNGFTLADLVSYDHKHNEANNEGNRDGKEFNLSWNCGAEGPTSNRKIKDLRLKLMKDAIAMVLLSQGVPMIYAGDEFGNSQSGNNNSYCQDNDLGWTDWSALRRYRGYFEFVKKLIAFRKDHKVLHMSKEPMLMDYRYYGYPDMSFHGSRPWYPEMEHYNRHIGVMLCGRYAAEESNVYLAFNLHWEKHELALPNISGRIWKVEFNTENAGDNNPINNNFLTIGPRSVIVLTDEKNS
ncbi:MAG: alpha-amylase family glycosyl hydrolase [Butyrivibrio sp.]